MQFSASTFLALAAIIPSTLAHMYVSYPPVYQADLNNKRSPLHPDGTNYPCYDLSGTDGAAPTYEPGTSQKFVLTGSAIHGGGSCQISITYDDPPTKSSEFRVLKSFNGDCPMDHVGNLDVERNFNLDYTIPVDVPGGKAHIAWTWINRLGNREMYMRCAPVNIKSSLTDKSVLKKLPLIFKAHIKEVAPEKCVVNERNYFRFPNPGADVHDGIISDVYSPVPAACGAEVVTPTVPEPEPETPVYEEPTTTSSSLPAATTAAGRPIDLIEVPETPAIPPYKPDTGKPVAPKPETPKPETPKPETPKPETPKPAPSGGRCPEDGAIICTSVNTWAVCDHGLVVPMGRVANGMVCRNGSMDFAKAKRETRGMRFGHEHRRRHHAKRL